MKVKLPQSVRDEIARQAKATADKILAAARNLRWKRAMELVDESKEDLDDNKEHRRIRDKYYQMHRELEEEEGREAGPVQGRINERRKRMHRIVDGEDTGVYVYDEKTLDSPP